MKKKIFLYIIVIVAVIAFAVTQFADIVSYIFISLVISALLRPISEAVNHIHIKRFQMPKVVGVFTAYISLIFFIILFSSQFAPLISEQVQFINSIDYNRLLHIIQIPLSGIEGYLNDFGISLPKKELMEENIKNYFLDLISSLNVKDLLNQVIAVTGSLFVAIMAIAFISAFLIYDKNLLRSVIYKVIPNSYFEIFIAAMTKIERLLSRYVRGVFVQVTGIFTLISIGLSLFGVNYAITIALFAALINIIPYIGPLLGILFGILVGLTTSQVSLDSSELSILFIKIISVFGVVQVLDNIIIQPIIFSKSVKAHPLEIFVVIFAGANLGGPIGMILAIPGYTTIKVIITEFYKGIKNYRVFNLNN